MFLPRFCIAKLAYWVLGFVQSYWWMNFNHVAWRYYTSSIDNFERMTLATELRQFYRRLRLGLDQSSHQINLEVILPSDSDCFCCGLRVGWHFFSHVLFHWHVEKRFARPHIKAGLQHSYCMATTCQLVNLLWARWFNPVLLQDWQRKRQCQVAIFIWNIWNLWNHLIFLSQ